MEPEKLNEDQRRGIKSLSGLEAVQKELGEVKKAIEVRVSQPSLLAALLSSFFPYNPSSSRFNIEIITQLAPYTLPRIISFALTQPLT